MARKKTSWSPKTRTYVRGQKNGVRQRKVGSRLITGPYRNAKGNDVYFLSAKGTNEGVRATIYKTKKESAKAKYGMILKGSSVAYEHSNNKATLLRKILSTSM